MTATFTKSGFCTKDRSEYTAGVVIDSNTLADMTITEFSKLFPNYESGKVFYWVRSPRFATWEEAFNYDLKLGDIK